MFSHPVSVTGYVCAGLAVLLAFADGASYNSSFWLLWLSYCFGGLAPFLILLGVIAQGCLRLERAIRGETVETLPVRMARTIVDPAEIKREIGEARQRATA